VANTTDVCPVCKSNNIKSAIEINDMPVYCNVLWSTHAQAMDVKKGDISLSYCCDCAHVYNRAFDEALMDYTEDYENSLHFSPKFNEYAEGLAQRLVDNYNIKHKVIVEIGCGKGDFLKMLCDRGNNKGHGFDKSYDPSRSDVTLPENITFYQEFFGDKHSSLNPDLICCRHVLEHIEDPHAFLVNLRRGIGDNNPVVYFEVPNVLFTLKDMGIWDLIYEHCGYFSESSLVNAFQSSGFEVSAVGESFGGQFLYIEARPVNDGASNVSKIDYDLNEISQYVNEFENNYNNRVAHWRSEVKKIIAGSQQAVIWGAGSKGVTFLNVILNAALNATNNSTNNANNNETNSAANAQDAIKYVIDLNPHKCDQYVPGTGQQVKPPEFLKENKPDKIIIMNPIYEKEITTLVRDMNIDAEIDCI